MVTTVDSPLLKRRFVFLCFTLAIHQSIHRSFVLYRLRQPGKERDTTRCDEYPRPDVVVVVVVLYRRVVRASWTKWISIVHPLFVFQSIFTIASFFFGHTRVRHQSLL